MDIYNNPIHKSKLLNYSKLHLFGIEMAFNEFRNYHQIIEASLTTEADKRFRNFNVEYEQLIVSVEEEGYAAHLDRELAEQVTQLTYYFPHAFRSSFLIQVFSFIEFELKEICNHHHATNNTDISLGDLKGSSDLDKAKIYLTKVCKVNLNNLQPEWNYLLEVRRVRNTLVHHSGIIARDHSDRNQLVSFIGKEVGIEFKEKVTDRKPDLAKNDLTIMITDQAFIERLLLMSEELFKKLLETGPVKISH